MLYKKVLDDLKQKINSGVYEVGTALPTERQLIEEYDVSRITIRKAVDELVKLNLVEKRRGSGTYVLGKQYSHELRGLAGTSEILGSCNKAVRYKVFQFSMISDNPAIHKMLDMEEHEPLYYIRRVKYIDDLPRIVEDSYMPVALFPDLNISTLEKSKFDYVERDKGMLIEGSRQEFTAVEPDEDLMKLLDMEKSSPVMNLRSVSNLKDGRRFDYTEAWFHPDAHKLAIYLPR
ncbi:predicted transcriptional regulator of N-acetylglucosamine utilization GntR family [Vibrio ponticus]|uniref:GntR family transcriptional regulator n=1 Tax=Vibrio rhodolitus TaxID=2231649 RepID=UPI000501A1D3|nr:GntR family transcriptional regulator [Vibrio rhodolitus]GAK84961.1 predicted transcriptional regulator of N-acetylglucosamine utilization GntR family [Vibrio ponticus]